ncbi:flavoprotein [Kitasatospora sp. HPMI-4]|uniref:flavoprotein n=1 Tax=Kitasatospora sp. HPMI-4 TaxID=3448443 RepID=UPI003F1A5751
MAGETPGLGVDRLLLITSGSASATGMPFWIGWLQEAYPRLEITMVVTGSAQRFVTRQALEFRLRGEVFPDAWPARRARALHVEWAEWAEAVVVYPATLHFMGRLAIGLADSPALLAAQCTTAPVAVAPALPPGGLDSAACRAHWATLAKRPNVALIPPVQGLSLTTGRADGWVPPPMPEVLRGLERCRMRLAADAGNEGPGSTAAFLADRTQR